MTDIEKLDWATETPANMRAVVNGMFGHEDGPLAALMYAETVCPYALVEWLCKRERYYYIVSQVVEDILAAEAEPPDAWDARDKTKEAGA